MRRTVALAAFALASIFTAVLVALLRPAVHPESHPAVRVEPPPALGVRAGGLRMTTQLDRRYLPEGGGADAYLQIDLVADADPSARRRVPVNAVLILDRSGSMTGDKLDRARDAARALVQALGDGDRLAIVEFGSDTSVLVRSTEVTGSTRARALRAIEAEPTCPPPSTPPRRNLPAATPRGASTRCSSPPTARPTKASTTAPRSCASPGATSQARRSPPSAWARTTTRT
jgi:hypothetical protein